MLSRSEVWTYWWPILNAFWSIKHLYIWINPFFVINYWCNYYYKRKHELVSNLMPLSHVNWTLYCYLSQAWLGWPDHILTQLRVKYDKKLPFEIHTLLIVQVALLCRQEDHMRAICFLRVLIALLFMFIFVNNWDSVNICTDLFPGFSDLCTMVIDGLAYNASLWLLSWWRCHACQSLFALIITANITKYL